jgi:hypothetical protein
MLMFGSLLNILGGDVDKGRERTQIHAVRDMPLGRTHARAMRIAQLWVCMLIRRVPARLHQCPVASQIALSADPLTIK